MPSIFTQSSSDPSAIGDTVSYTLSITGDVTNAFGVNAVLNYNADVLRLTAATFDELGELGSPAIPTDASGPQSLATFSGGSLNVVPAGSNLITFTFEVIAQGDTSVSLTDNGTDPFVALEGGGELPPPAPVNFTLQIEPDAVDDDASVDEGGSVSIPVLDNDVDEGDTLNISAFGQGANGSVTQDDDNLVYTPNAGFSGSDSFEYTVEDTNGGTDTATVTVDVAPDAPVGSAVFAQTTPDPTAVGDTVSYTLSITGDVTNAFGVNAVLNYNADVLRLTAATFDELGELGSPAIPTDASGPQSLATFSGGSLNVVPAGSNLITFTFEVIAQGDTSVSLTDNGTDPFVALEGGGELPPPAPVNFTLQIEPDAVDDDASVDEGGSVSIPVLDNDVDEGDTLNISAFGQGANGSVTQDDDNLVYTPNAGFSGSDSFEYTVEDTNGGTDTATVTVDVAPDAPVGSAVFAQTTPDPTAVGDTVSYTLSITGDVTNAFGVNAVLNYNADVLRLTAATFDELGELGSPAIPTDASGPQSLATFSGGSLNVVPAGSSLITFTFEVIAQGDTSVSLTDNGTDPFVALEGGGELPPPAPVNFDFNFAPDAVDDTATTDEDTAFEIDVLENDSDPGDAEPTIASFGQGANGTVTSTADGLTYDPDDNFNGMDSFTYTVEDGDGEQATATVNVIVNAVNDAPTGAVTISGTAQEGETLTASNDLADVDGLGPISYQWRADGFDIAGADTDTLMLGPDEVGAQITAVASYTDGDGEGESVESAATAEVAEAFPTQTGTVTLVPTPGPYNIGDTIEIEIVTSAGFPATFAFQSRLAYDADILSFSGVDFLENFDTTSSVTEPEGAGGPTQLGPLSGASFDGPLPSGEYTAATLSFEVLSTDPVSVDLLPFMDLLFIDENNVGIDLTDPVTLDLVLNTGPDAVNDSDNVLEEGSVAIDVLDNDTDPNTNDTLTIDAFSQGARGTVTETSGSLTYAPDADFFGTDSFSYTITDGNGGFDTATVDVTVTNVNDDPTGAVLITGTAEEDQTLTADTSGVEDADGLGTFSYQWFANGTAIAGATGATLTLTQAEVGAAITVAASYTDDQGTPETVSSDPTDPVANVNDDPTGAVLIDGTVEEGQELTANISGLADEDGLGAFSYQWFADGSAIAGAIGETLTLTQAEVGKPITVEVSYEDGGSTVETVTSDPTAQVANVNDDPTGAVVIDGLAAEDQELTANTSALADADGLGAFSYQWFADGSAIAGAIGETLTLTQAEVGKPITVEVSYEDGGSTVETVTSDPTAQVANVNDDPTGAVLIDGTVEEGQELTANISGLADEDGLGAFSYQWFADGSAIAGAIGETLTLTQAEVGKAITVEVSYEDGGSTVETVTSDPTAQVANVNDDPTGAVVIDGLAAEDQELTANTSALADADGLGAFSYQWFADGSAIAGAIGETLTLTQAEVGKPITVEVSYEDGGSTVETVTSAATDAVTNVNDAPGGTVTIAGTATEGQTLTASNTLTDEDGLTGPISYQWRADGADIAGATGDTLELGQDQVGAAITVVASYTDDEDTDEAVASAATAPVSDSNEAPIAEDDTASVDEDGSVTIDVLDNDSDPDGGTPAADEVLYRVNVGGPEIPDPDGVLAWGGDTGNFGTAGNSPYLFANTGGSSTFNSSSSSSFSGQASSTDPSIPAGTPGDIFQTERYDADTTPEMQWKFPVQADFGLAAGDEVIVRLYFAELFNGIAAAGERVFDVSVEGAVPAEFDDIDQFGQKGPNVGFMLDTVATLDADGTLDLELIHDVENPALKGIEILTASAPTSGDERFLTVAIDTGPTEGSVVVNPDGTITYTPNADYNGSDSFIYQITDADGATDTATVDVEVEPVNDPPELTVGDEFDFLDSDPGPVFTAMATDVDGDTLTFALGGTGAGFFDIDPTSGEVTLSATTPPEFTIADGDIASIADVTQSFDLTVSVTDDTDIVDQDVTVNFLKDTDGDGIADAEDNALFVANADQRDTNGDGYGNIIDADLDNDGFVLPGDLFLFKQAFGSGFPLGDLNDDEDVEANADFNGDGAVTNGDLVIFRNLFGEDVQTLSLVGDAYDTLA